MYLLAAHIIAFSALLVNSFYDVLSEKGDVPDLPAVIAIAAGIILHAAYSFQTLSWTPFLYMIGIGLVFSAYGWIAYWKGLWGGADAMAMTVLGFAAPYSLSGPNLTHALNIFVNMLIVGLIYTVGFAVYRAFQSENLIEGFKERVKNGKKRIGLEMVGAAVFSAYAGTVGLNPYMYFIALVGVILLYRFLKVLENSEMTKTVAVEDLEGGEVVAENGDLIEGISEEEIEDLEEEEVEIKEGLRFIPVFPAALLITDVFGAGIYLLLSIF